MTKVISTVEQLKSELQNQKVGAVFTMGALHAGHAQLMKKCRELIGDNGILVVTIFVNPTQFTDQKDLEKYPRNLDGDVALCEQNSVDIVFAPSFEVVYPTEHPVVEINPGKIANMLEGKSRPGHFAAVATVVNRLLEITNPEVTCFGEKDFQQLAVVKQMVKNLGISTEVIGVPTVREPDGLAMSSRNQRLLPLERAIAIQLHKAMEVVRVELESQKSIDSSISTAIDYLKTFPEIELDYLDILSNDLETPKPGLARVLIAAKIGDVRLIDNIECELAVDNV